MPPQAIDGLEERLRSRFEGGLVVALEPPDRALREKLFARFLARRAASVPTPALLAYLAERPVRERARDDRRRAPAAGRGGRRGRAAHARARRGTSSSRRARRARAAPRRVRQAADAFFLDDEKIVWEWPDVAGRLIEELR